MLARFLAGPGLRIPCKRTHPAPNRIETEPVASAEGQTNSCGPSGTEHGADDHNQAWPGARAFKIIPR